MSPNCWPAEILNGTATWEPDNTLAKIDESLLHLEADAEENPAIVFWEQDCKEKEVPKAVTEMEPLVGKKVCWISEIAGALKDAARVADPNCESHETSTWIALEIPCGTRLRTLEEEIQYAVLEDVRANVSLRDESSGPNNTPIKVTKTPPEVGKFLTVNSAGLEKP